MALGRQGNRQREPMVTRVEVPRSSGRLICGWLKRELIATDSGGGGRWFESTHSDHVHDPFRPHDHRRRRTSFDASALTWTMPSLALGAGVDAVVPLSDLGASVTVEAGCCSAGVQPPPRLR
jgi:hypothetical protein